MGTYTPNQFFYKPDSEEFVDVDQQINYNLQRADERVGGMIEWQYTTVPIISGVEPYDVGYKFYKASTNALYVCRPDGKLSQPAGSIAATETWTTAGLTLQNGYRSVDYETQQLSYRWDSNNRTVMWRGSVQLGDPAAQIPLNTSTVVCTIADPLTNSPRPIQASKYFFVHMGTASGGFSVARVMIKTNGEIEINRMGINQGDASQRYISFNGISYDVLNGDV